MKRRACFFIKVEVTLQGKEYKALFRCDSNSFRNLMILFQFTFKGPASTILSVKQLLNKAYQIYQHMIHIHIFQQYAFGNDQKETQRIKVSEVLQYDRHIINRRDKS